MATGTLTGQTIANTYKALLKITGADAGGTTLAADAVIVIEDGDGNPSSLSLSQQRATITLGSGAADDFIVDGTTFVVEGDNNRVGIGTNAPSESLTIAHSAADGDGGILIMNKATTIADDVFLGGIGFDSGVANIPSSVSEAGAAIVARSAVAHSSSAKGADLLFLTTAIADADDTSSHERMRIDSEGIIAIGTSDTVNLHSAYRALQIGGNAVLYANADTSASNTLKLAQNVREEATSGDFTYISTDEASVLQLENGGVSLRTAPSGTANATASMATVWSVTENGLVSKPLHPGFLAQPGSNQTNIAVGSPVVAVFGEVFDQGGRFSSNTFTAPVTGKYQLNAVMRLEQIPLDAAYIELKIKTSNRGFETYITPGSFDAVSAYWSMTASVLADMDINDTATIEIVQSDGTQQIDISTGSFFSGFLAC